MGTNWNSKESKYKPIVKESTKVRAQVAKDMVNIEGKSVAETAEIMGISISRIYEYLKELKDEK